MFDFDNAEVMQALNDSGRSLDTFNGFLHRTKELRHSYEKFRFEGDVNKPPFEEIYHTVKSYLSSVLPKEKYGDLKR